MACSTHPVAWFTRSFFQIASSQAVKFAQGADVRLQDFPYSLGYLEAAGLFYNLVHQLVKVEAWVGEEVGPDPLGLVQVFPPSTSGGCFCPNPAGL